MKKLTKNDIKAEVVKRIKKSLEVRGIREADVTDLWQTNSKELQDLFKFSNWQFTRVNGKIIFREKVKWELN